MRLWILDRDGAAHSFLDPWQPCFYLEGADAAVGRALQLLRSQASAVESRWVDRTELFSGETRTVLEVRLPPLEYGRLVEQVQTLDHLSLYNADIHLAQAYHYERGHFPTALCTFEVGGAFEVAPLEVAPLKMQSGPTTGGPIDDGRLLAWELRDDPWALDYDLPPLRIAHLARTGSLVAGRVDPNHAPVWGNRGGLTLSIDGSTWEVEGDVEDQIESIARWLKEKDPDVITSEWGDGYLLPRLLALAQRAGRPLSLSRDGARGVAGRSSRSFHTYGRTVYQSGCQFLFGRWHLDLQNSFLLRESRLEGLIEIARIAKIPVQRAARCTIGTSLTSMQLDRAWQDRVLVPLDKQQTEDFRPASDLVVADKGGLAYEPEVGWHENVVEYDFVSMYPTLMVGRNISPETVNCGCGSCRDNRVPEVGHHLCRRRAGLVPKVLAPILVKRSRYKALSKSAAADKETYKLRATAHKWTLVCCFGYLGFKNARFGKIEAHECVTAYGRDVLLRAKETVEARGLHVLHALVDSLWVQTKAQTTAQIGGSLDFEELRRAIEKDTGCPVGIEGVYRWVRFCPSRRDRLSGVPGRYFGTMESGEIKVRGIAARRRDTPPLFKSLQAALLERLAMARNLDECQALVPELREIAEGYRLRLKEGRVTADEIAIAFQLSQEPDCYRHDTLPALAAKQLAACGVKLHPGECVRYVIVGARDKVKSWRVKPLSLLEGGLDYDRVKYLELLDRAVEEIIG